MRYLLPLSWMTEFAFLLSSSTMASVLVSVLLPLSLHVAVVLQLEQAYQLPRQFVAAGRPSVFAVPSPS